MSLENWVAVMLCQIMTEPIRESDTILSLPCALLSAQKKGAGWPVSTLAKGTAEWLRCGKIKRTAVWEF